MLIKGGLCRPVTFLFVYKTNLRCSTIQSNMLEYSDYFFVINSSKIISVQKMCCFVTFINKRKSRLYADSVRQELQWTKNNASFFYTSEANTTSLLSYTGPPWKHGSSDWGAQYLCTDCYPVAKTQTDPLENQ